jgi:predicted RNase H-like HicB family nuclease
MKYTIVLKKTQEGYSVFCPGLPGCWSQGDSEAEALDNIREAIRDYLAAVAEYYQDDDWRQIDIG